MASAIRAERAVVPSCTAQYISARIARLVRVVRRTKSLLEVRVWVQEPSLAPLVSDPDQMTQRPSPKKHRFRMHNRWAEPHRIVAPDRKEISGADLPGDRLRREASALSAAAILPWVRRTWTLFAAVSRARAAPALEADAIAGRRGANRDQFRHEVKSANQLLTSPAKRLHSHKKMYDGCAFAITTATGSAPKVGR